MKKLSILVQWLFVAALLGFVGYVLWRPMPLPDYRPDAWQAWDGVTVLSYAGIARQDSPGYPTAKRLEEQLTALKEAGYRTVRPEDVAAFLEQRAPLPDKALLLIFEGGRKEAFIRATPVLQRTGFSAVLAVPTSVMDQWGGFYLKRKDIARLSRMPQWQVGSMGHRAIERLPNGGSAESARFLAHRIHRPGDTNVTESADAFRNRIIEDYEQSARLLEKAAGRPTLLYLYPFAETGQSPGADPLAEAVNRDAVTRSFGLAVIGGSNPFNGPGSDPWSLNRLRVPGDWTAEQLLAELESSRPRRTGLAFNGFRSDWVFERGGSLEDTGLHLSAGAAAWLRGTESWRDADLEATLAPEAGGTASLYARYASPRSWLRVAVAPGELRFQERLDDRLHTLYRHPLPHTEAEAPRNVRLRLRNNRAWVWLDDQPLAANLPLSPRSRRGRVGLGSQGASLRTETLSARPLPARWLMAHSIGRVEDANRSQVQAILPTWFRASDEDVSLAQTFQQDLLDAAVTGIRTIPLLARTGALADEAAARAWATAVDNELIRTDVKLLVPELAVEGSSPVLAAELRNLGYRLAHVLTPAQALESGRSIAQATEDETIVVNGTDAQADHAVAWLQRAIPPSRITRREPDGDALGAGLATFLVLDSNGGVRP